MEAQRLELKLRMKWVWFVNPTRLFTVKACFGDEPGHRYHPMERSNATIPGASRMDKRTIVLLILPSLYRDEKQKQTDSTKAEDRCC